MTENPRTWTDLEYAIQAALEDFESGMGHYGLDLEANIARELREGGFINEQNTHTTEGTPYAQARGSSCCQTCCTELSRLRTS